MFIDSNFNISSTKFADSRPTLPDVIFEFNTREKTLIPVGEFKTVENPYYFGEVG